MATTLRKVEKIWQIVRLKQVKRWRVLTTLKRSPILSLRYAARRLPLPATESHRIPSGFFAIYVGGERRRFLIPTRFLKLRIFVTLLKKAEEEFGFESSGGIVLPCDVEFFRDLLRFLEKDEHKFGNLEVDAFLKMFSEVRLDSSCKKADHSSHSFSPLLQRATV